MPIIGVVPSARMCDYEAAMQRAGGELRVLDPMHDDPTGVVRGINVYRIEAGPRLAGQWATLPGNGTINTETLTLLKRLSDDE